MRIRVALVWGVMFFVVLLILVNYVSIFALDEVNSSLQPMLIEGEHSFFDSVFLMRDMAENAKSILFYDEVLTQSARNFAFTGDKNWRERYDFYDVALDSLLKYAVSDFSKGHKGSVNGIIVSNNALVLLERESMRLAGEGRLKAAVTVLDSEEYALQKKVYSDSLGKYVNLTESDFNVAVEDHMHMREANVDKLSAVVMAWRKVVIISSSVSLLVLIGFIVLFLKKVLLPIEVITKVLDNVSRANLKVKLDSSLKSQKNEIGLLACAFDRLLISMKLAVKKHELLRGVKKGGDADE